MRRLASWALLLSLAAPCWLVGQAYAQQQPAAPTQARIDEANGVLAACRTSFGTCAATDKLKNCAWSYSLPECSEVERTLNTLKADKQEADDKDAQKQKDKALILKFLGKKT